MKTIIFGDIHGRTVWRDILNKENPDLVVFLGDYVSTHENISSEQQIENLLEILLLKENCPERTVLLRGNHDIQHLGYYWAECSGLDRTVLKFMSSPDLKDRFLKNTVWLYTFDMDGQKYLCSHAGVSQVWFDRCGVKTVDEINTLPPSELFSFTPDSPWDFDGNSPCQPCTWIRPVSLYTSALPGYNQIVGHTPLKLDLPKDLESRVDGSIIWLCDTLHVPSYLVVEDNRITPVKWEP